MVVMVVVLLVVVGQVEVENNGLDFEKEFNKVTRLSHNNF